MKTQITKKLFTFIVPMAIVMMFSASSNAQIVYRDVIPDDTAFCSTSNCSDTITVDLNKDGNLDFILTFNRTNLGSCPGMGRPSPPRYAIKWGCQQPVAIHFTVLLHPILRH